MAVSPGLLTIGEFAKRCRLTVVALRHYDREGLLAPAEVDASTGYRYYGPDQVAVALQLALLRRVDVSIADLRALVTGQMTFGDVLERQRARLLRERVARDEMLEVIDALIAEREPPTYHVVRELEPPRRAVALVVDASWDRLERATRHALARLSVLLVRRGSDQARLSTGALFPVEPRDLLTLTVFAVAGVHAPSLPLATITLPGGDVMSTVHDGDPRLLGYAYRALLSEVAALGLRADGDVREHYTLEPDGHMRTRLVLPVSAQL